MMKSQISRSSYLRKKGYSGVYQQQGRMITDADWNEQVELGKKRLDDSLADAVASGAPREGGLRVTQTAAAQPLTFSAGRLYAEGVPADVTGAEPSAASFGLDRQRDLPLASGASLPTKSYLVYADVWERSVTSLEDPDHLRDPALHGADTTSRTRTMAQLKWCTDALDPEDAAVNPPSGDAPFSLELHSAVETGDPCDPCAEQVAVESRVGNYLFRLEVHAVEGDPANPTRLTLKWSSENGAEQHDVDSVPEEFKAGRWLWEFFDTTTESHLGVHLKGGLSPAASLTTTEFPNPLPSGFDFVRRWDGSCTLKRQGQQWGLEEGSDRGVELGNQPGQHGHTVLGSDLSVRLERLLLTLGLENRTFVAGDTWLAEVREAEHDPTVNAEIVTGAAPEGVRHHYVLVAEVDAAGKLLKPSTERLRQFRFPPLTDLRAGDVGYQPACPSGLFDASHDTVEKALNRVCSIDAAHVGYQPDPDCKVLAGATTVEEALHRACANWALYYVSGDGQQGRAGDFLAQPLEARVANGRALEPKRRVRFRIAQDDGKGQLEDPVNGATDRELIVLTDAQGVARCRWRLGVAKPDQRVEAHLVDERDEAAGGPVAYNATFAALVGTDPGIRVEKLSFGDGELLDNEVTVEVSHLAGGIQVHCGDPVSAASFARISGKLPSPARPNFEVSLDLPYPLGGTEAGFWGKGHHGVLGFRSLTLAGEVAADGNVIAWKPLSGTRDWLVDTLFRVLTDPDIVLAERLLARLTLRGNFIWGEDQDPLVYLDGETFGRPRDDAEVGLILPSGNGRSGGDFEAWFWIVPDPERPSGELEASVSGSTVSGRVLNASGNPVGRGTQVQLLGTRPLRVVTTDNAGKYSFPGLPTGSYTVSAQLGDSVLRRAVVVGRVVIGAGEINVVNTFSFDNNLVDNRPITEVPGVGPATMTRLRRVGLTSASDLAQQDPKTLKRKTGISEGQARNLVLGARRLVLGGG